MPDKDVRASLMAGPGALAGRYGPVPRNGEINTAFGVYKSLCCEYEIVVREGATFPQCPKHPNVPTVWNVLDIEIRPLRVTRKTNPDPPS